MNRPSQSDGNWGWRYRPGALAREVAEKLALLVEVSDRQPVPVTHAHEAGEFAA
jgi:4-alpha-glucanotransferase